jgi:peptide/nickel transport system substrate-binding protein
MIMIACLCASIALPSAFAATKYKEAPMLAELVKAGKLPSVEKRLPENPLVVGDEIRPVRRRVTPRFRGPRTNSVNQWSRRARPLRADGATINEAGGERHPVRGFQTWTVKLRKGMKWSDGCHAADDIMAGTRRSAERDSCQPSQAGC